MEVGCSKSAAALMFFQCTYYGYPFPVFESNRLILYYLRRKEFLFILR